MKGFAMLKIGEVGWIEKDMPKCGPNDAICKPLAIAVCTSDIHTVYAGAIGERHNMILGHEATAEVVEVGSGVKDFKPGDRVIVPAITPDWNSVAAQAGFAQHSGSMLGGWKFSNFKDGVFGEFFHVNDADGNLAFLPEGVSAVDGTMITDMVTTGFHGAEMADIQLGDVVIVFGIGPVGLMAVAGANLRGASRIIVVDPSPYPVRKAAAIQYGATDFINDKDASIEEQILEMTKGAGADRAIVAGGGAGAIATAVKAIKAGGKIGNLEYLGSGDYIPIPRIEWGVGMGHKQILGGLTPGGRLRMEKMTSLVEAGRVDVSPLSTHVYEGWEHMAEALEIMRVKPSELIKSVVKLAD